MLNAQQEAVAAWQYIEQRGAKPSIRMVGRLMRDMGISFADRDLRKWLQPFAAAAAPHGGPKLAATAPHKSSTNAAVAPHGEKKLAASAPRLRARNKVSLVSDLDSTPLANARSVAENAGERKIACRTCDGERPELTEFLDVGDLVDVFLAKFANRTTVDAQAKHRGAWSAQLRLFRADRHSWLAIWDAFALAHADGKHRPFHGLVAPAKNLQAAARAAGFPNVARSASLGSQLGNVDPEARDGAAFRAEREARLAGAKS